MSATPRNRRPEDEGESEEVSPVYADMPATPQEPPAPRTLPEAHEPDSTTGRMQPVSLESEDNARLDDDDADASDSAAGSGRARKR